MGDDWIAEADRMGMRGGCQVLGIWAHDLGSGREVLCCLMRGRRGGRSEAKVPEASVASHVVPGYRSKSRAGWIVQGRAREI